VPNALTRLVLITELAKVVPREQQTGIFGLSPTSGNVGAMLFPSLASAAATFGSGAALLVAVVSAGLSAGASVRLRRLGQPPNRSLDEPEAVAAPPD
jgi:hypothetical protein